MTTPHYDRVKEFMQKADQDTPDTLTVPDAVTRMLRAKLILEEALETIGALGVRATVPGGPLLIEGVIWEESGGADVEGVVDGCADLSVVTVGTLISFGVKDEPVLREVDAANLRKFGPGGYRREDGKWMKPPNWTPPNIMEAINA